MTQKQLESIINEHKKWLNDYSTGKRAILQGEDLHGLNLCHADLRFANLVGADLSRAILMGTNLKDATLRAANLFAANLGGADLRRADLTEANLRRADLIEADLRGADFLGANLSGSRLTYAFIDNIILDEKESYRKGVILKDAMIGYKKCRKEKIVTLEIPKGALVFCINGSKCRTNRAIVKEISKGTKAVSRWSSDFIYHVGDEIEIENFNLNPTIECSTGIHFFRTKEEADNYEEV